ncbi:MAG: hypothetical protein Q7R76_05190 [Candidatus Woesearchaeota archaeon]|nr:hypothetical protein [Candidatus Woesearchaeota archaeon]
MKHPRMPVLVVLFALLAFSLTLAGCAEQKQGISTSTPFLGGTNGLLVSFVREAPPESITDDGKYPFGVAIQLENGGEADVPFGGGYAEIVGINPVDFGLPTQAYLRSPLLKEGKLSGARKNFDGTVIPGMQTVVQFPFDPSKQISMLKYLPNLYGNTNVNVRANVCYDYRTKTTTKICVKQNLLAIEEKPPLCLVNEPKNPQNSGAPVHITAMSEAPIGEDKVQLTFTISHVGAPTDSFFAVGSDCDDSITNPQKYVVFVNVTSDVNGAFADCSGLEDPAEGAIVGPKGERHGGFVRMYRGQPRTVTCTIDLSHVESTFEELFEVELLYRYMQSIEKPMLIRDVSVSN